MTTRRGFVIGAAAAAGCATATPPGPSLGGVRRISPALDALIAPDATIEQLGSGFQWTEGPLWDRAKKRLFFTDVPGNTLYQWCSKYGVREVLKPSGFAGADASHLREGGANGLAFEAGGALLMCDTGNRTVARLDLGTMQKTVLAERFDGMRFNSPNDLVVARTGAIYFTDPPFGLAGMSDSPLRETPFHGVYRLTPDGAVTVIERELMFPNGIAFSPDQSLLYVSGRDGQRPLIKVYAMGADGLPSSSREFFDMAPMQGEGRLGSPDGMKVDAAGNLFATGPGGVMVITPAGEALGVINTGGRISNCAFGEDGRTLFVTAHDKLGRIRTRTRGY
ncbi:MAG: SMP-30/gluconolactonase/LRE family protein [Hyphomonadaceae bacterium]|nr:SMP-30/gluconolactonase/LRE family protein [Hyphomonadaceae bacterium]